MGEFRAALACVCLVAVTSCATGPGGRGSGHSPFPSRSEVDALTRGSGAVNPFAQAAVDADTWSYSEPPVDKLDYEAYADPTPWGKMLSEHAATDPQRFETTRSMHCAARELARFYLQYSAMPAMQLRQAMLEHCGALTDGALPNFIFGPAAADQTDAMLHYAWQPNVRGLLHRLGDGGPMDLGIAFARDDKKAVVVILSGVRKVQIQPERRVAGADGVIVLRGRARVPADRITALINQGRYAYSSCAPDRKLRPPEFSFACAVAPGDQSGRIAVFAYREGKMFGQGLLGVEALRDTSQRVYRRVSYTNEAIVSDESQLAPRLHTLVNEVRRQAGLNPVALSDAQSATSEKLARTYFEAAADPAKETAAEVIIIGLLAGWDVGAPIRDAGFTAAAVGPTRDASEWISAVLSSPGGRLSLLDPSSRVVAFGPIMVDSPAMIGSLFTAYTLFDPADHAAAKQRVLERIRAARAEAGLPPPILVTTLDGDASALASEVQGGAASPTDALGDLLQTSADVLGRSVHGMVFETSDPDLLVFPQEVLTAKRLELSVTVTHYQPEGEPWGRYVILLVIPGAGTQA